MRHGQEWQNFKDGLGRGWQASFDEQTGLAYRAWGPAIWFGQAEDSVAVERMVRVFIDSHPEIFQAKSSAFSDIHVAFQPELDSWLVDAQQSLPLANSVFNDLDGSFVESAPVWRGKAKLQIRSGWLDWFGAQHIPESIWPQSSASLSATEAADIAKNKGPHPESVYSNVSAELVFLPLVRSGQLRACLDMED